MRDGDLRDTVLLAIPPGGVPVAEAAARALSLPWGLFFSQGITHPESEGLLGGIAWSGRTVWDRAAVRRSGLSPRQLRSGRRQALLDIRRRARRYDYGAVDVDGAIVLIDDGTSGWPVLLAAVRDILSTGKRVSLATPMGTKAEILRLVNEVDTLFCPSLGSEERREARGVYWERTMSDPEALTIWSSWTHGPENIRNLYHTVSSSSGISYDR